jgi:putative NADH-flavin reductase
MTKLGIFGGSGRTGRLLVQQALAQGYSVKALVRTLGKLAEHPQLETVLGDATDEVAVAQTVDGCDAVVSVLGHSRNSAKDIQTVATRHIVSAMRGQELRRVISLTGAGVRDPLDHPTVVDRLFRILLKTLSRDVLQDAEEHTAVLRDSGLDYTIVRSPRLTDGSNTGIYKVGYLGQGLGKQISRADVASFMLVQLHDDTWIRKMPVITY